MNFIPTRASALEKLDYFIENGLKDYSKARNFDYGPDKRDNTSCCLLYTSPSPRDKRQSRMPSSA